MLFFQQKTRNHPYLKKIEVKEVREKTLEKKLVKEIFGKHFENFFGITNVGEKK